MSTIYICDLCECHNQCVWAVSPPLISIEHEYWCSSCVEKQIKELDEVNKYIVYREIQKQLLDQLFRH